MGEIGLLTEELEMAWRAFERPAALQTRVNPSFPILFFGDLSAYLDSEIRVLTVGLNPSLNEFPQESPFQRFPTAEGVSVNETGRYLDALSAYFRTDPYSDWFKGFELMLNGIEASYYKGQPSTALHTDICSPVATAPTWSGLDSAVQKSLETDGGPLWHRLLDALRPQIVVLSVARRHLSRIEFKPLNGWHVLHVFRRRKDGNRRKVPLEVRARWGVISGEPSLLIHIPAARKPLGNLDGPKKQQSGAVALEEFRRAISSGML